MIAAVVGVTISMVAPAACSDDKSATTTTQASSSATKPKPKPKPTTPTTLAAHDDDVFDLRTGPPAITYRGGTVTSKQLSEVSAKAGSVKTPMPVVFTTTVDAALKDRARNQLLTVVAAGKDDRGVLPRADPIRVSRTPQNDVAIFAIIDNPTKQKISDVKIAVQLLAGGRTPAGSADFVIPASELKELPAGSVAVTVLTVGKDRLTDPAMSLSNVGVRMDLRYKKI